MTLPARTYFEHLKAYVNSDYIMDDGAGGKVVLAEKYFRREDVKPQVRKIELLLPGAGMAFKLDHDDFETAKRTSKPALFHFLDDNAKPWSKRCDFLIINKAQPEPRADGAWVACAQRPSLGAAASRLSQSGG